ncbi:tetratricopeptide repeat protein [Pseudomonas borbori]
MASNLWQCIKPAALAWVLLTLVACASQQSDPTTAATPSADEPQPQGQTDDAQAAMAKLQSHASSGDLDSQFQLGSFYFVGKPKKDLQQAEYWWKQAADKGHPMAAVSLAYLYTGRDNPELADQKSMLKYLNQAAAGGNPMAQHILGNLYMKGDQGVARDPSQARRLFQSACAQEYKPSCAVLDKAP